MEAMARPATVAWAGADTYPDTYPGTYGCGEPVAAAGGGGTAGGGGGTGGAVIGGGSVAALVGSRSSVDAWPARATCTVHCDPSQYRTSVRPSGSGYQPAGATCAMSLPASCHVARAPDAPTSARPAWTLPACVGRRCVHAGGEQRCTSLPSSAITRTGGWP